MKSVIKNGESATINYPCLMTAHSSSGSKVVLFTNKHSGTVVYSLGKQQPIGYYSEAWEMSGFTPFDGTIELSNN